MIRPVFQESESLKPRELFPARGKNSRLNLPDQFEFHVACGNSARCKQALEGRQCRGRSSLPVKAAHMRDQLMATGGNRPGSKAILGIEAVVDQVHLCRQRRIGFRPRVHHRLGNSDDRTGIFENLPLPACVQKPPDTTFDAEHVKDQGIAEIGDPWQSQVAGEGLSRKMSADRRTGREDCIEARFFHEAARRSYRRNLPNHAFLGLAPEKSLDQARRVAAHQRLRNPDDVGKTRTAAVRGGNHIRFVTEFGKVFMEAERTRGAYSVLRRKGIRQNQEIAHCSADPGSRLRYTSTTFFKFSSPESPRLARGIEIAFLTASTKAARSDMGIK